MSFATDYYEDYWQHRIKTKKVSSSAPNRVKVVAEHLTELTPKQKVLDIGCGEGSLGRLIGEKVIIDGTDISASSLKLSKKHYRNLYLADITEKKDQSQITQKYDGIVSLEIIEHLIEPQKLLQFAYSHLKKDGRYLVSFPNTAWWKYRLDLFFKGKFIDEDPTYTNLDHLHFFTLQSLTGLLEKNGFVVEAVDGVFTLPWYFGRLSFNLQRKIGQRWPGLFGYQVVLVCKKKNQS